MYFGEEDQFLSYVERTSGPSFKIVGCTGMMNGAANNIKNAKVKSKFVYVLR